MSPIEWTESNQRELQEFLNRETGQKVIQFFKQYEPQIKGDNFQEVALSAKMFEQRRRDKNLLYTMLAPVELTSSSSKTTRPSNMGLDLTPLDVR